MTIDEIEDLLLQTEMALKADKYEEGEMLARKVIEEFSSINPVEDSHISDVYKLDFLSRGNRSVSQSFWRRGMANDALPFVEQAIIFAIESDCKLNIANALGDKGVICDLKSEYNIALEYYFQSIKLLEELGKFSSVANIMGNVGNVYLNLGSPNLALEYYFKAKHIHEEFGDKSAIARVQGNIGNAYEKLGLSTLALENYKIALSFHEELGELSAIARITGNIGHLYLNLKSHDLALEYLLNARRMHKELGVKTSVARVCGNIGSLYSSLNSFHLALEYYNEGLSIFKVLGNKSLAAQLSGNIGLVYYKLCNYTESLEFQTQALAIYEELDEKKMIARFTGNIGTVYFSIGSYHRALDFFRRSLELNEELKDKSEIARNLGNIGSVYNSIDSHNEAMDFYKKALSIHIEIKNNKEIANLNENIGNVYFSMGTYNEALEYFTKSLSMHEVLFNKRGVACVTGNLGRLYSTSEFTKYNPTKSEKLLLESVNLSSEIGAKQLLIDQYKYLTDLYIEETRWEESVQFYKKHHELYIEVQNEDVKKQADKFAWERKISDMNKKREIELLKSEAEKALLEETIIHQKKRLKTQAYEVENSIQELVKKNGLLQQIQSDIRKIAPHTKHEGIDYIEQLLERVSRHITPLDSVKELDKQWTVIHSCFIKNLQQSFPDLTTMELKIAVLLNMKFTSANIGSALFLAKRTVEFHRHNLRKKMRLETNDDIYQVLATYASQ